MLAVIEGSFVPEIRLNPGDLIAGRYQVRSEIGRGGMSLVLRCYDPEREHDVAVKLLPAEQPSHADQVRFEREVRAMMRLDHPHIVRLLDHGEHGRHPFLVMQLIRGSPLASLIPDGGLPLDRFRRLAGPMCEAIYAVHEMGIVHRDIKEGNFVVDSFLRPVLIDFGVAKQRQDLTVTRVGRAVGTPLCMAPEVAQARQDVDHRADIYSLGVLFFRMLSGRYPFESANAMKLMIAHVQRTPPRLRTLRADLPPPLEEVVHRALEKDPAARYQDARALARALDQVLAPHDQATTHQSIPALRQRGMQVLLVARSEAACQAMRALLPEGWTGLPCPQAEALLQRLAGEAVGLILLDGGTATEQGDAVLRALGPALRPAPLAVVGRLDPPLAAMLGPDLCLSPHDPVAARGHLEGLVRR